MRCSVWDFPGFLNIGLYIAYSTIREKRVQHTAYNCKERRDQGREQEVDLTCLLYPPLVSNTLAAFNGL
ncbi:hypothetical protein O988_08290 [Pseudogymnoascus sp. VKM F-3808]|nr:hypothetical protein O988_08290 [Pseudogymnoascus sp. VKM F-3808]